MSGLSSCLVELYEKRDAAYIGDLATRLRALICFVSGGEGLLWRLVERLGVDDTVFPSGQHVPLFPLSVRDRIKNQMAFFVDGVTVTHEELIKRIASDMGLAHDLDGVTPFIAKLNAMMAGDAQMYFEPLVDDACLTLEIGERVIRAAVESGYVRKREEAKAPDREPISNLRFLHVLDVPKVTQDHPENTVYILFLANNIDLSRVEDAPWTFAPQTLGSITVYCEITRRYKLRVRVSGLKIPNFGFQCSLPQPFDDQIPLSISWKGFEISAWAFGKLVAGISRP